jgi:hypothetical protein
MQNLSKEKMVLTLVASLFIVATTMPHCKAGISRLVEVSYFDDNGFFSRYSKAEVSFIFSNELNPRTITAVTVPKYKILALVYFENGKVAIVLLDAKTTLSGFGKFTHDNFESLFGFLGKGTISGIQINGLRGQDAGRPWRFKAREGFKWVDPRMNDF